jgi:hypothetical protein
LVEEYRIAGTHEGLAAVAKAQHHEVARVKGLGEGCAREGCRQGEQINVGVE